MKKVNRMRAFRASLAALFILSAALFGFSHMGVIGVLFNLGGTLTLAWGLWTFFGGLVFSLVRQKTGSILAPALLHGLPQAIASIGTNPNGSMTGV